MIATLKLRSKTLKVDLSKPLDISIALIGGDQNVNAWYLAPPRIEPHQQEGFTGSVAQGASVNFNDVYFNPHSHVTHTETVGHILEGDYSINQSLKKFYFLAELITVAPEHQGGDFVISKAQLQYALGLKKREALIIRTLPNTEEKKCRNYSHTNPPYLTEEAAEFLLERGVDHLLVDLPSVDREEDQGRLLSHNAFWNTSKDLRTHATITELIYVPNSVDDGTYLLNLQLAPVENDAAPSRPLLFKPME